MNSTPLGTLIEEWIASDPDRNLSRLSERSGIGSSLLGKYIVGRARPTPRNLGRLAQALGVAYEYLMRMCKYLPPLSEGVPEHPEPTLQDKQDAIAESYKSWMAVMAPRMGELAASDAFWRPFLAEAQRAREEAARSQSFVESAVSAALQKRVSEPVRGESAAPNRGEHTSDDQLAWPKQPRTLVGGRR